MSKVNSALVNAETLATALGTDGTTVTDSATSALGAIGANNANNAFSSTSIVANEDGSVLERLEQIQEAVNKGSGTALAANKSIIDALGTDGSSVTDSAVSVLGAIGANNANNAFSSSSVVANADGSVLERQEAVQTVIGTLTDTADETPNTATIMNLLRGILAKNFAKEVYKTVEFDGNAGSGGIGTVALFTVTGAVKIKITAICTETLVGAATLECGISGATNAIIPQIVDATALAAGEIWYDGTPTTKIDTVANAELQYVLGDGQDIYLTIGTANITDGTIVFKIVWEPLTSDGSVVAA